MNNPFQNPHPVLPSFVERNNDHREALHFLENVETKKDVDYKWVVDYAKQLWEYENKVFVYLDEKADSIIRYLGGGLALFTLGMVFNVTNSTVYLVWWSLPSIVFALVSVLFAILARTPKFAPSIPTIENAKEYADSEKKGNGETCFLGQYHLACTDTKIVSERKANYVIVATWLYYSAIVSLLAPIVISAVNFSTSVK